MKLTDRTKREEPKSLTEMNDTEIQIAYQSIQLRLKEARERMEFTDLMSEKAHSFRGRDESKWVKNEISSLLCYTRGTNVLGNGGDSIVQKEYSKFRFNPSSLREYRTSHPIGECF